MPLITLLTDMGTCDHYVAVVKAAIYRHMPDAQVIDISHAVRPYDINQATLLLRASLPDFPKGTVHIVGVVPERTPLHEHLAVGFKGQFIVGADNGVIGAVVQDSPDVVHSLEHVSRSVGDSVFPVRDVFTVAACHIAKGGTLGVLGNPATIRHRGDSVQPTVLEDTIRGMAVHTDNYGNVITNIHRSLFDAVRRDRAFEVQLRRKVYRSSRIRVHYNEVPVGEMAVLFGASGFMEVALNQANAAQLIGMKHGDAVMVVFK